MWSLILPSFVFFWTALFQTLSTSNIRTGDIFCTTYSKERMLLVQPRQTTHVTHTHTHTHTHSRLAALCPGLPGWAGISWAICKSALRSRQHPTTQVFLQGMPFLPPKQQRQSTEDYSCNPAHNGIWEAPFATFTGAQHQKITLFIMSYQICSSVLQDIACTRCTDEALCYITNSTVGAVSLLGTWVSCAKMAKAIKVCFFRGCSRSHMDPCITSCSISLQRGKSEVRHLPPIAPGKYTAHGSPARNPQYRSMSAFLALNALHGFLDPYKGALMRFGILCAL